MVKSVPSAERQSLGIFSLLLRSSQAGETSLVRSVIVSDLKAGLAYERGPAYGKGLAYGSGLAYGRGLAFGGVSGSSSGWQPCSVALTKDWSTQMHAVVKTCLTTCLQLKSYVNSTFQ